MTDDRKRWETGADGVRSSAPAWLTGDLLPWWLWAGMGVAWGCWGAYLVTTADGAWDVVTALVVLLLVAPSQLIVARRRKSGSVFGADSG